MKNYILILFISILATSCSESFESINPDAFNKKIAGRKDIETAEELITLFYAYNEGNPEISISTEMDGDIFIITLIHRNVPDDSVSTEKIAMIAAKNNDGSWHVIEIRSSWRCRGYRGGHEDWGSEPCP